MRLSVKLITGFADPRWDETRRAHPLFPSLQLCPGAPRSHQRTWADKDGAKPHQSSVFSSFPLPPMLGFRMKRQEGWLR